MSLNPDSREGAIVAGALEAAGWTVASEHGGLRALLWPDGESVLVVPVDPGLDDYDSKLDEAIEVLAAAAKRGRKADEVLDRLTAEGVIS